MQHLYPTIVKILEEGDLLEQVPSAIRVLALYCVHFIDRRAYRRMIKNITKKPAKDALEKFLDLKDSLDFSIYKNHLFCAIWTMCGFKRKTARRYKQTAHTHQVLLSDLVEFHKALSPQEQKRLRRSYKNPKVHTAEELTTIVEKLEPVIRGLSKHYLTYVARHDKGLTIFDIRADLRTFVIYAIRRYELNFDHDHLMKTVVKSLQHQVLNLAGKHGRPKRRRIERTHKVEGSIEVWFLDRLSKWILRRVSIPHNQKDRMVLDGQLSIRGTFVKTNEPGYFPIVDLYASKKDAQQERILRSSGLKRHVPLIFLGKSELDEYQVTHTSLLQERGEEKTRLIDLIPSTLRSDRTNQFLGQLSKSASFRLQEFAELVCNRDPDALFEKHLCAKNRDLSILTVEQLGKLASRYLGVPLKELQQDLLSTHANLWSLEQQKQIVTTAENLTKPPLSGIFTKTTKME